VREFHYNAMVGISAVIVFLLTCGHSYLSFLRKLFMLLPRAARRCHYDEGTTRAVKVRHPSKSLRDELSGSSLASVDHSF